MKFQHIILFILLLITASCRKELEYTENTEEKGHITFTVDSQSRVSQEGSFEEGDAIGIFAIEPITGVYWATNNKYVYSDGKFKPATADDDIVVTKGTDFDFYVYYPYNSNQRDITNIAHVCTNQDSKSGWVNSDFMTATYTDAITDYSIPLNFKHRYATVEVHVNKNDGVTAASMKNVKYSSRFNLLTGQVSTDDSRTNLNMYCYKANENGSTVFRCTVPVQTLSSTSNYVTLTGSSTIDVRAESDMVLAAGKIQNYSITYQKHIQITDYLPGGTTTGSGYYKIGTQCTVTATPKSGYEFVGWYENNQLLSSNQSYTFEVLSDRTLVPKYRNYSSWTVNISANPTQIKTAGGNSAITASAVRNVYINGELQGTATGTVSLSSDNPAFVIQGTTVRVSENTTTSTRSANITASCGGVSKSVTLTQPGRTESYVFTIDGGTSVNGTFESSGGTAKYTIVSQKTIVIDGNSTTVQANWSSSWNTSSFGSLGNDGTLIIAENPNTTQRAAVITLTQEGSGKQVTITVRQKKKNSVDIED